MNNEKYAVYERNPAHGSTKNGMILGPFNSKEEAQSNGEKYGYAGDNYYVNSVNNEKMNQIIDEAYGNYTRYPLATIHDHHTNILYQNRRKGWCMLNGRSMASPHPTRHLTKEEFINKCKTDQEFSEKWGLKIEERELSLEERRKLANYDSQFISPVTVESWDRQNIPTKLITITYNDETVEIYE